MIHKKGDKLNPRNYPPIAVLSCILKLFTHVLHTRLADWATKCNILPESQGGFRKQRGCDDQIFILNTAITLGTRSKKKVYACFLTSLGHSHPVPMTSFGKNSIVLGFRPNSYDSSGKYTKNPQPKFVFRMDSPTLSTSPKVWLRAAF